MAAAASVGALAGCLGGGGDDGGDEETPADNGQNGDGSCPPADLTAAESILPRPDAVSVLTTTTSEGGYLATVDGEQYEVDTARGFYEDDNGAVYRVTVQLWPDDVEPDADGNVGTAFLTWPESLQLRMGMQGQDRQVVLEVQGEQDVAEQSTVEMLYDETGCFGEDELLGTSWE